MIFGAFCDNYGRNGELMGIPKYLRHDCFIGELIDYDNTSLVSLLLLKQHIENQKSLQQYEKDLGIEPCKVYSLHDYCDRRKSTDLYRFIYCPVCGEKIEWDKIKKHATD